MADWSDIAGCYRWMHDKAEKKYTMKNMYMTIPVIVLSTLTGTASVGIGSIAGDNEEVQKYLNFGIGGLSLVAGILTTLNNFLRFAQLSESNKVAGIAWGKFQRLIAVELALSPNERMDSLDFLKICRAELDRLIEQSPAIPDSVINEFEKEFKDKPTLRRPDICHGLDRTHVYDNSQSRLKNITSDAALMLMQKKKILRQEILPDLNRMIDSAVSAGIDRKKKDLEDYLANAAEAATSKKKVPIDSVALYKAAEVDFKGVLEQRKKAIDSGVGAAAAAAAKAKQANTMITKAQGILSKTLNNTEEGGGKTPTDVFTQVNPMREAKKAEKEEVAIPVQEEGGGGAAEEHPDQKLKNLLRR